MLYELELKNQVPQQTMNHALFILTTSWPARIVVPSSESPTAYV